MYLDEYNDPSEDLINDWNIHNDHSDNDPYEDVNTMTCDTCEQPFVPHWDEINCDACMTEYWRRNPDPADIAEREEIEAENFGLEDYHSREF